MYHWCKFIKQMYPTIEKLECLTKNAEDKIPSNLHNSKV